MSDKGVLLIVSGPSGAGKGTICNEIINKYPEQYALSISATSRQPRGNEVDGKEYFFKSREEFEDMIKNDMLLEHVCYVNNYYGTPKAWVEEQIKSGINVILEIDLQGGFQVAEKFPDALLIFILPPSREELIKRLTNRGTETEEQIRNRIARADEEMKYADRYDYVITNDSVEKSVNLLHNIIQSKKMNKNEEK